MDFIFTFIDPKTLPVQVLCFIFLLFIVLKNVNLEQNIKIALLYLVNYAMIFFGIVNVSLGILLLVVALFLLLEILTSDSEKKMLLSFWSKILDCVYKLFFEYYFWLYLVAIGIAALCDYWINQCNQSSLVDNNFLDATCETQSTIAVYGALMILVIHISIFVCLTRMKFETKSITDIMQTLQSVSIYSIPVKAMRSKFDILIDLEDRTFMQRKDWEHSVFSGLIVGRAIRKVTLNTVLHPFRTVRKLFARDYGTIEMQLLRDIGVIRKYGGCKVRRKSFEIIYSGIIFKSYRKQFDKNDDSVQNFRLWILWCYIQKAPVKFARRYSASAKKTTAEQVFGKKFEDLSKEEFFVWCIGLGYFVSIDLMTIDRREDMIKTYKLSRAKINKALKKAYAI